MGRIYDEVWNGLGLDHVDFPQVVAVVGSGGKTSLIGQLAQAGTARGLRVAVLTTTHMWRPPVYREEFLPLEKGTVTVFGKDCGEGKITFPGDACYEEVCRGADLILVEADGSRGLPVKYPGPQEPVIPGNVDRIVCVCGMSGLGRPGRECCHRWELALGALTVDTVEVFRHLRRRKAREEIKYEEQITEEILSLLLEEGYGRHLTQQFPRADFYYCMNQADNPKLAAAADRILQKTGRKGTVISLKGKEKHRIAFIYMASGFGKRFGSNKLLAMAEGKPLYSHGLETLRRGMDMVEKCGLAEGMLIVVSQYPEILQEAQKLGCIAVYNPNSAEGITASIHLGVEAAGEEAAYLFAVADQPWLRVESVVKLVEEFLGSSKSMACLADGNRRGNPVIFSEKYREDLMALTGDKGGARILNRYPEEVLEVQTESEELMDVDSPEILNRE